MKRSFERKSTTAVLTVLALVAFAANSVFCRLALAEAIIDPASYTAVRLITVGSHSVDSRDFPAGRPSRIIWRQLDLCREAFLYGDTT